MWKFCSHACSILAFTFLCSILWAKPATALPFTATWSAAPTSPGTVPGPSPFYDCSDWGGGGLICEWLWDQGLEVTSVTDLPLYGDGGPFYDAFGTLHSGNPSASVLRIRPRCQPGLNPCFNTFTPLDMSVSLFAESPAEVFFASSRGGFITAPAGNRTVTFMGGAWTDIDSMEIGISVLGCDDPESQEECGEGELGLDINRLRFEATPIPEPASALLFAGAVGAALRHARRRRRTI